MSPKIENLLSGKTGGVPDRCRRRHDFSFSYCRAGMDVGIIQGLGVPLDQARSGPTAQKEG